MSEAHDATLGSPKHGKTDDTITVLLAPALPSALPPALPSALPPALPSALPLAQQGTILRWAYPGSAVIDMSV